MVCVCFFTQHQLLCLHLQRHVNCLLLNPKHSSFLPTLCCRVCKGAGSQLVVSCVTMICLARSNSKWFYRGLSEAAQAHMCVFTSGTSLYFSLGVLPVFMCVFWYGSAVLYSLVSCIQHPCLRLYGCASQMLNLSNWMTE